jgi:hypothetical protein
MQGTLGVSTTNGNYQISFVNNASNAYVITPATLVVTPNAVSTTYSGAALNNGNYSTTPGSYNVSGYVGGQNATSAGVSFTGSMNFNGSTSTTVENASSYALTQGTLGLTSANGNYTMSFVNGTPNAYVITPATLVVTPTAVSTVYNGSTLPNTTYSDALGNYTVSGLLGSDTAANTNLALTGSMAFAGSTSTVVKNAGSYALTAGTLAGTVSTGNYVVTFSNTNPNAYVITPAALTLTPNASSTTYNDVALNNATYSGTLGNYAILGFVSGENASNTGLALTGSMSLNGSTATSVLNAGRYALTQGSLRVSTTNDNYQISFVNNASNAYVITPAMLHYTVTNSTGTSGTVPSLGGVTLSGVLGLNNVTGIVTLYNAANNPVTLSASMSPGTYTEKILSIGGTNSGNYELSSTGNTWGYLLISGAPVTLVNNQVPPPNASTINVPAFSGTSGGSSGDLISIPPYGGFSEQVSVPTSPGALPAAQVIYLNIPSINILNGIQLLTQIQIDLPEVNDIVSVTGLGGTALPQSIQYDPATGIFSSPSTMDLPELEITFHDKSGKTNRRIISLGPAPDLRTSESWNFSDERRNSWAEKRPDRTGGIRWSTRSRPYDRPSRLLAA